MEETTITSKEIANKYDQAINDFFTKMSFNENQKAMFYLGRMLNTVEFIQKDKKKTVIHKVNFNGLDLDDIERLRVGLMEKAKQYGQVGKLIFSDRKFNDHFDYNKWAREAMNPREAVFFLLTGYSFGITKKDAKGLETTETNESDN